MKTISNIAHVSVTLLLLSVHILASKDNVLLERRDDVEVHEMVPTTTFQSTFHEGGNINLDDNKHKDRYQDFKARMHHAARTNLRGPNTNNRDSQVLAFGSSLPREGGSVERVLNLSSKKGVKSWEEKDHIGHVGLEENGSRRAETCVEKAKNTFWWENMSGDNKVKTCAWLQMQKTEKKDKACGETEDWFDGKTTWSPASEVCPVTCDICSIDTNYPSASPSSLPSSLPSAESCVEELQKMFWWENMSGDNKVKTCKWLQSQSTERREKACGETEDWFDGKTAWSPASEVCPITCDICSIDTNYPSASPSSLPSSLPSAEPCAEDKKDMFWWENMNGNIKVKTCGWLGEQSAEKEDKACGETKHMKKLLPAREVCPITCGICTSYKK